MQDLQTPSSSSSAPSTVVGFEALDSYANTLAFLNMRGRSWFQLEPNRDELLFIKETAGVENIYRSLTAVAPAVPDGHDEEWNPLSQRPHSPIPPPISDELGAEVSSLKEAIDAFTTLSHEMMHIALCEPFFTGHWRPKTQAEFRDFFLMSEGFCFFFADIVVSERVRTRLPDGEMALERSTPSNANFHPIRAFEAHGIRDKNLILDLYLNSFSGRSQAFADQSPTNGFAEALRVRIQTFYSGSQPYLKDLYAALQSFGALKTFYKRFCAIEGLPSILPSSILDQFANNEIKPYFENFYQTGLATLHSLPVEHVEAVRARRMLQMRAYYALQVRWLLAENQIFARSWTSARSRKLLVRVDSYLTGLERLLHRLAKDRGFLPFDDLGLLDDLYDSEIRSEFVAQGAWTAHRWLIAPKRANGGISIAKNPKIKAHQSERELLATLEYLMDELLLSSGPTLSLLERSEIMSVIHQLSELGSNLGRRGPVSIRSQRRLRELLAHPKILQIWSLPLASFDPNRNQYREILFSYK